MTIDNKLWEEQKKVLIDKLLKLPPIVLETAYLYAINYINYGEDITEKWITATQNACALDNAYRKGYYDGTQKVKSEV